MSYKDYAHEDQLEAEERLDAEIERIDRIEAWEDRYEEEWNAWQTYLDDHPDADLDDLPFDIPPRPW